MVEETASPSFHYWDTTFVKWDPRNANTIKDARDLLFQPLRIRWRFGSPLHKLQTPSDVKTRGENEWESKNLPSNDLGNSICLKKKNPCCFQERVLFSSDSWTCYLVEYWSWISNPPAPTSWFWDYSHHPQFDVELWIKPRALDTVDKQTTNSAASSDHCWVCWSIWDSSPTKVRRHKKRQICGSIKTMHYKKKLYKSRGSWCGLPKSEVLFWPPFILVNHLLSAFIRVSEYPYLVLTCSQTVGFSRAEADHLFLL